jgi:4-hydroxybenzoate polyprenyltransferase
MTSVPVPQGSSATGELVSAPPARRFLTALIVSMRPAEWSKNVFVLIPVVFAGRLREASELGRSIAAFAAFCAVASAGYLVNDIRDAALDREHPRKRFRPIARGELSPQAAGAAAVVLAAGAGALAVVIGKNAALLLAGYGVLTFTYSLVLKTQVILDVLAIAGCFLLRVLAGAAAIKADPSEWLIVCTAFLAMFLGFAKRRQEAASEQHLPTRSRPVLEHYSLPFLDQMMALVTTGTVLSYVLYTVNSPLVGDRMFPTSGPVLYGMFRYLWLVYHKKDERDTATLIRHDPGMLLAGAAWVVLAAGLLYIGR